MAEISAGTRNEVFIAQKLMGMNISSATREVITNHLRNGKLESIETVDSIQTMNLEELGKCLKTISLLVWHSIGSFSPQDCATLIDLIV